MLRRLPLVLVVAFASGLIIPPMAAAQIGDPMLRAGEIRGQSWRVFAVDLSPEGPLAFEGVEDVRQPLPPPAFAVLAKNRSDAPIASYTLAAVVVRSDSSVIAIQPLPPIRNLRPGQSRRQEVRIRVAALSVTDRVAFVQHELPGEDGSAWTPAEEDLRAAVKLAADRLPVP